MTNPDTKEDAECVCVFPDGGYDTVPPDNGYPDQCFNEAESGHVCTREPGHDGRHVACNPHGGHNLKEWGAA